MWVCLCACARISHAHTQKRIDMDTDKDTDMDTDKDTDMDTDKDTDMDTDGHRQTRMYAHVACSSRV